MVLCCFASEPAQLHFADPVLAAQAIKGRHMHHVRMPHALQPNFQQQRLCLPV
jgi:hypothetical protein